MKGYLAGCRTSAPSRSRLVRSHACEGGGGCLPDGERRVARGQVDIRRWQRAELRSAGGGATLGERSGGADAYVARTKRHGWRSCWTDGVEAPRRPASEGGGWMAASHPTVAGTGPGGAYAIDGARRDVSPGSGRVVGCM